MTPRPIPCAACGRPLPEGEQAVCACGCAQEVVRFQPFRVAEPVPPPVLDGEDVPCAYHVGNRAEAPCRRCGSFLCRLCATPVAGETYCPGCFDRLRAARELPALSNQIPRPHSAALVVSLAGLVPFAIVLAVPPAAWLGWRALRSRREIALREPRWWGHLAVAALVLLLGALLSVGTVVQMRPLNGRTNQILVEPR